MFYDRNIGNRRYYYSFYYKFYFLKNHSNRHYKGEYVKNFMVSFNHQDMTFYNNPRDNYLLIFVLTCKYFLLFVALFPLFYLI